MSLLPFLRENSEGTLIDIYVQPRASKSELAGVHEGVLKVRLTAPPVEGEANKECGKFFAKLFGVPKSGVEIVSGQKSRHKTVLVRGIAPQDADKVLRERGVA
ncbi:MAG: DUF167 domain-containing protein [Acidobacteriota bacterium]